MVPTTSLTSSQKLATDPVPSAPDKFSLRLHKQHCICFEYLQVFNMTFRCQRVDDVIFLYYVNKELCGLLTNSLNERSNGWVNDKINDSTVQLTKQWSLCYEDTKAHHSHHKSQSVDHILSKFKLVSGPAAYYPYISKNAVPFVIRVVLARCDAMWSYW